MLGHWMFSSATIMGGQEHGSGSVLEAETHGHWVQQQQDEKGDNVESCAPTRGVGEALPGLGLYTASVGNPCWSYGYDRKRT